MHFRKVYAAFALDQTNFFGSSDVQFLRVGTVVKGGILLPPTIDTPEHNYNLFSISIAPEIGQDFFEAFGSVFTPEDYAITRGESRLIFEVKLRAPQYWQMKIRILLNATCKNKLEDFTLGRNLVVKKRSCVEKINTPDKNDDYTWCPGKEEFDYWAQ